MLHGAFTEDLPTCVIKHILLHTPAVTMSINTQLADIVAKGRLARDSSRSAERI